MGVEGVWGKIVPYQFVPCNFSRSRNLQNFLNFNFNPFAAKKKTKTKKTGVSVQILIKNSGYDTFSRENAKNTKLWSH